MDHSWQDELYAFQRQLLPEPVIKELRKAKTVIIVPHHVLHYFPFVALVTQPDRKKRTDLEMVEPTFLLDESFDICHAPSLTAWCLCERMTSGRLPRSMGWESSTSELTTHCQAWKKTWPT